MLILDEADRMLDMGFLPPLKRIAATLPRERQTLQFSATLPDEVINLSKQFTRAAVRVDVSGEQVVAVKVTHQVHHVSVDRKRDALTEILTQDDKGQALVFCRTKHGSDRVGKHLERSGISAAVIHGNKSQGARVRALGDFKAGRVNVLVATDIAARGLDIVQLPLVVNYDLPMVPEDYIHRAGRTGRAGLTGRAVSLVSHEDRDLLRRIQRLLPSPIEHVAVDGFAASAAAEDRPAAEHRHHHGARPNRFGGTTRFGGRHQRHGASSRVQAASRRSFARG
jgi:ATP-dependent RNA helicase RhlE